MLEALTEYWYFTLFLIILIIVTPIFLVKASKASRRHSDEVNKFLKKAEHEKALREAYGDLTEEKIAEAKSEELFEGVALCLEADFQKNEDTDAEYKKLTEEQRHIYALYYLLCDARETALSSFFKNSTPPLTTQALAGAEAAFGGRAYEIVRAEFNMFDESNEAVSIVESEKEILDREFAEICESESLWELAGRYIKENYQQFIN